MSPVTYNSPNSHFSQHSPPPPLSSSHAHPPSRHSSIPQSPARTALESPILPQSGFNYTSRMNGTMDRPSSQGNVDQDDSQARAKEEPKATRTANPMSFSSILSSNVPDPQKSTPWSTPSSKPLKSSSNTPNRDIKPSRTAPRKSAPKRPASPKTVAAPTKHVPKAEPELLPPAKSLSSSKHRSGALTSDKENEKIKKEMAKIDAIPMSPIDLPEYEFDKQKHATCSQKRKRDVEDCEEVKRKACRSVLSPTVSRKLTHQY